MKTNKSVVALLAERIIRPLRSLGDHRILPLSPSDGERARVRGCRMALHGPRRIYHANSLLASYELPEQRLLITNHELPITVTNRPNLHPTPPIS